MKLRIRGDSLRLRLTRGEVQQLRETGSVVETIHFGTGELHYELRGADVDAPVARFDGSRIEVSLPRDQANAWADGEQVGIAAEQALEHGSLTLLIEKDFRCLAPREGEDDGDAFPHPGADSGATC
ncbi:MAG TPA: hypothetical protein VK034_02645 [Enhygromyxa sp.]|nr:hypothetical protein [Enhygromyxa sp.]